MSLPELDEPLSTIPTHTIPTNPLYELDVPSRDSGPTAFSGEKHVTLIEPSDGPPEEKKRRVDVDDPLADPKEVIAQLKSDLMRVHNSLKMAANAHFKLSLREQEYAELKKQLQQVHSAKDDLPPPSNYLVNDHLVVMALKRQAAEIQKLKEDVEREREFNEARKFNTSNLGSLKLVAKVHAMVKENEELGNELTQEQAPNRWHVVEQYKQFIERVRSESDSTVQYTDKLKKQIQDTELNIFKLQQTAKTGEAFQSSKRDREQQ